MLGLTALACAYPVLHRCCSATCSGFSHPQSSACLLPPASSVPHCSQYVALGAVEEGRAWVEQQVEGLAGNREALVDALSPLGALGSGSVVGGEGAIYLFAKLPEGE
jgi:hypothetical protein